MIAWRISVLIAALLMMATAVLAEAPARSIEGRAIWMNAGAIPKTPAGIAQLVKQYSDAGVNILMPEVIRRGYTIYPSSIGLQDPEFAPFDPVETLVTEAHRRGMEVHAWVWVFRVGHDAMMGGILTPHPEWAALSRAGENVSPGGGRWLCPSIPEAREHLRSLYTELATRYNIDGLHLDYVRFENESPIPYCYNESCRSKFQAEHGVDPIEIDPLSRMQIDWNLWRERQVNTFVQAVSRDMRRINPRIMISAAVASSPTGARTDYMQNWPHWSANKWVDFLCPMTYHPNTDRLRDWTGNAMGAVNFTSLIFSGLGAHLHKTPETTLAQIDAVRKIGTSGVAIFASSYFTQPFIDAVREGPFAAEAKLPFRVSRESLENIIRAQSAATSRFSPSEVRDAANLLAYIDYRAMKIPYIVPTRPPITLPDEVPPLPSVVVPRTAAAPVIDGDLAEDIWSDAVVVELEFTNMGEAASVPTEVRLAYDDKALYVAFVASEPQMDDHKANETKRDGAVFYDDSAELFLDPTGQGRVYYHLAANTLEGQFDQRFLSPAWNADWTVAVTMREDSWVMEMAVPFAAFGVDAPTPGSVWTANLARNRWVTGQPEYMAWSITYGSYNRLYRFGELTFGE